MKKTTPFIQNRKGAGHPAAIGAVSLTAAHNAYINTKPVRTDVGTSRFVKAHTAEEQPKILKQIIPALILLFIFLGIFAYTHDDKVYLGGDNLTYFHLGQALATGQGYVDITAPVTLPHNVYPPGYPFILSIAMRLGFTSLEAACALNNLLGFACVLLSYLWVSRITASRALGFTVGFFLLLNGPFIGSSMITMSEVPSLFFVLLAMYLMSVPSTDSVFFKDYRFWLLLLCAITAYHIRTSAMMLLPAILTFYLFRRKWIHAVALAMGFVVGVLPWMLRTINLGGNAYIRQFKMKNPYQLELGQATMSDYLQRVVFNIGRYISSELPSALLQDFYPDLEAQEPTAAYWAAGIAIVSVIIYGIIRTAKTQPAAATYLLLSAGVILCWPAVWFGSRFLVPLMPFLIFMIVYAVSTIIQSLSRRLHFGWNPLVLCISGLFMLVPLKKMHASAEEDYPANFQSYITAAEWTKKHLPPNCMIACRKAELFYYFSGGVKSVMYPFEPDQAKMLESFRNNKVTHVVVDQLGFSSTTKYLLPAIQNNAQKFTLLYQDGNPPTYIVAFDPKK